MTEPSITAELVETGIRELLIIDLPNRIQIFASDVLFSCINSRRGISTENEQGLIPLRRCKVIYSVHGNFIRYYPLFELAKYTPWPAKGFLL